MQLHRFFLGVALVGTLHAPAGANEAPTQTGIAFFESKIRPVLIKHCYECHSAESGAEEGGLQVDSREALRRGGERGPAIVPRDPKASLLLAAVSHSDPDLNMPPKRERLPDAVLADLRKWIEMGAPDPRDDSGGKKEGNWGAEKADGDFWAYQPPRRSEPTAVRDETWPRRELDRFILAQLTDNGFAPSPDAPANVLVRRLYFDLIGLPPSPEDLARFDERIRASGTEAALTETADELLASPQFGERWGRHWLDVARFAESSGKEANISFPYAFRYRDYVIDSLNDDVPFDGSSPSRSPAICCRTRATPSGPGC